MAWTRALLFALLSLAVGCDGGGPADSGIDSGPADAGADAAPRDLAFTLAGMVTRSVTVTSCVDIAGRPGTAIASVV